MYHLASLQPYAGPALSCDDACASKGLTCLDDMQQNLTATDRVRTAFEAAGHTCSLMQTKCEPTNCESWGAPYVYGTEMKCQHGTKAAACDVTPVDRAHHRLCACLS